ncbi:LCP family protein [Ruminococcus sp. 5_1_39BFAA]|uniref:LCP family protein n=1 Tax=Ruminococcus sp. 5_1_39BFAA TaxID=457412 RepID=UPI0035672EBE
MEKRRRHMSGRSKDRLPGKIITAVLGVAALVFVCLLVYTRMVPGMYMGAICLGLAVLVLVTGLLVWKFHHLVRFIIGTILAVVLIVAMGFGGLYIYRTTTALDTISGVNTEVARVAVYVKNDDAAENLNDTKDYTYGVLKELDRENTDAALEKLDLEFVGDLKTKEYSGLTELIDGLEKGETEAVLLNEAYLDILEEMEGYENLESEIREVGVRDVETVIERRDPVPSAENNSGESGSASAGKKEAGKVYTIFISGIDTRGGMTAKSRSDVNIIATVNTETRQVLLVSTPRDFFVPLSISNGVPDKLTHAGIYGVTVCMDTLSMLYDIGINYYFRLNFGGFVNIIDALGGITVQSDYDFDASGYHFNKGENQVNGEQALAFARERYAFSEGDRQRGRDQMHVIEGVIKKAMSPELLKNYSSILSGVEGSFETNIPYEEIALLIQSQLTRGGSWNVVSYSANGTGDTQKPYSMSQKAYVMVPDQTTVDKAKTLMQAVRDGETISAEDTAL